MTKTKIVNKLIDAIRHYNETGKHKEVRFKYDPEERTQFNFSEWKNDRDADSVRRVVPEDLIMSRDGNFYVVGFDLRYNLKQFTGQEGQHYRSYRLDRIIA